MTARAWLPANALLDSTIPTMLAPLVNDWAVRWLADARPVTIRACGMQRNCRPPSTAKSWESAAGEVAVCADGPSQAKLAQAMLGSPETWSRLSDGDRTFLAELSAPCVDDLVETIVRASGAWMKPGAAPGVPVWRSALKFSVSPAPLIQFDLYLSEALATAARLSAVSQTTHGAPTPEPRERAASRQRVQVGAKVGSVNISLSDLAALSSGDILILDRPLGANFDLSCDGAVAKGVRCEVIQDGPSRLLRVAQL